MRGGESVTVNGIDVSRYGVQQWFVQPELSKISNSSEWTEGVRLPTLLKSTIGFKKMKVGIMIRGKTRQEIWEKSSDFIAALLEPQEYRFDGFDHIFFGCVSNAEQAETCLKHWHKATIQLEGYEYGAEIVNTSTARNITINNEGNLETPAIVEVTPLINLVNMTLTGFVKNNFTGEDRPIIIRNLTKGRTITINGESGLITEGGANKFKDVELWDLPVLQPGMNSITVDKDVNITIRHKPRYL